MATMVDIHRNGRPDGRFAPPNLIRTVTKFMIE